MTTHAPMARVPFAPLDNPRLQHLASAKNRQNGILTQKSSANGKGNMSLSKNMLSPNKRPLEPATFDDFDSENVDPALLTSPSKKSKSDDFTKSLKPFSFSLAPSKSMPPPSTIPSRLSTPSRASMSSPRAPLTEPAGRSPKRKATSLNKYRRISAPFSRVDPPFGAKNDSGLPFSLDAALNGTFSISNSKSAGATIQESMPKNWFFDIYEDTLEETSATLMEHSTLTLDLSSDEESSKRAKDERGKENTPPEDYDAPTASRPAAEPNVAAPKQIKKTEIIRTRIVTGCEMDDGERSPLSDLETESFISEGLSKDSHVIVDPTPENESSTSTTFDLKNVFVGPVPFTAGSAKPSSTHTPSKSVIDRTIVTADGEVKGDIIIWEDSPASARSSSPSAESHIGSPKVTVKDENTDVAGAEVL